MGKTFVEDERPCDLCVNVTRYGCVSWNCEYINRDEAIKAWREKREMADRKTENSSEKPNNCEDLQDWKDRMWAEAIVTEPTISKMEQVDKDINVRSKDEPQIPPAYCKACKHDLWSTPRTCGKCTKQEDGKPSMYEPKDEQSGKE